MIAEAVAIPLRRLLPALLVLSLVSGGQAQATFERNPFFEQTEAVLRAHGLEMLSARLLGVEALVSTEANAASADEDELGEVIEAVEVDFRRIAASLAAENPVLAESLADAIEDLEDAHADGDVVATGAAAGRAAILADDARGVLFGDAFESDPAFAAAVMAILLTTENGGIGEGYEEAVEGEVGPYATAWVALDRIRTLWVTIEPLADDNQHFEVEDMLAELGALIDGPRPGPEVARSDPEEAEGSTQRLAGFLEEIVDADLFPSRDLGRLLVRTRDLTERACEAYAAGDDAEGLELASNAAFVYGEYLGNTLALFSPEAAGEAAALYDALAPGAIGEEEGEEEEEGIEREEAEEQELDPLVGQEALAACTSLVEQLETAGGPFGI